MSVITDLIDENSSCNARIAELEQDLAYFPSTVRSLAETVTEREAEINQLRAELSALKAQEPIGWYTEDHLDDKSATTYSWTVAERWVEKGWPVSPLYAAPVSEAKAQGVVMPAELDRAFITGESCDGVYRVVIQSEKLKEMLSVHRWLASLNAAPVQQVSVPASAFASRAITHYEAALLAAFPSGSSGEVFNQWNEARRVLAAAPAAPAADAGHVFYGMDGNHP